MHHPQSEHELLSFPVLTAVHLVCRHWLPSNGDQSLARIIDAFLDEVSGSISLSAAYKTSGGSLRFLQYLTSRELPTIDPILQRWEFNNVTGEAAAQGDLTTLRWLVESYRPEEFLTQVVPEAVDNGHLHILEWLWGNHRSRTIWGGIELCLAKGICHHDVVHWLRARTEIPPEHAQDLLLLAAKSGDVELVRVLYEKFSMDIQAAVDCAVGHCQWDVIDWVAGNCKLLNWQIVSGLVRAGNLDRLKVLVECRSRSFILDSNGDRPWVSYVLYSEHILDLAAECGHLHIVKWLHEEKGITDAGYIYMKAARNDHLDVLKYLYDKKMKERDCGTYAMNAAKSLETVKWLHSHFHHNKQCSYLAMDAAAIRGDLELVQWFHANRSEGCSTRAMNEAAFLGHLNVVKWLHANRTEGCYRSTMEWAARRGHLEVVRWLHANRSETFDVEYAIYSAAARGNLEILQWFHENRDGGCSTDAMDSAASNGHLEVVKWLHKHRSEGCTKRAMDEAVEHGHLEVVKWLHWNRSEGCTTDAIDMAAGNGHMKVVKWLHANRSMSRRPFAVERHLNMSDRLDEVAYLVSEFPGCRNFPLKRLKVSRLEVVEWLLAHTPNALDGCILEVWLCNRYLCEWLQQHNWRGVVQNHFTCFSR